MNQDSLGKPCILLMTRRGSIIVSESEFGRPNGWKVAFCIIHIEDEKEPRGGASQLDGHCCKQETTVAGRVFSETVRP